MKHFNQPFHGAKFIKILLIVAVFLSAAGFIVMSLWNWLAPTLFGGPTLTFLQALGLLVLCRLLFGGMRGPGFHGRRGPPPWRRRMQQRLRHLSPEEREKVREQLRCKWRC